MTARFIPLLLLALGLPGCEKAARNMYEGARTHPLASSERFADGMASRPTEPLAVFFSSF